MLPQALQSGIRNRPIMAGAPRSCLSRGFAIGSVEGGGNMPGALEGIRVIDFGQYIAGPVTAMLLADHDADVIRVDPPGGPRWKTPANATWNRNKRSIALDLKKDIDRATAQQ